MNEPLLTIDTGGDIMVFRSPDTAARWLEAIDVRDGEYKVVDLAGRHYRATAIADDSAVVLLPADAPPSPEMALQLARRYLSWLSTPGQAVDRLSFAELRDALLAVAV
jgi:hypothetical protein